MILHWSRWIFPEGTAAYGEPVLEQVDPEGPQHVERPILGQGRDVRRKEQQRCFRLITSIPHLPLDRGGVGVRN